MESPASNSTGFGEGKGAGSGDLAHLGKETPPKPKRNSKLTIAHGQAEMKVYPLAHFELWGLSGLGLLTSVFFSSAGALIGYSADVLKDINLTTGLSADKVSYWTGIADVTLVVGIVCAILGVGGLVGGGLYIKHVVKRTKFG